MIRINYIDMLDMNHTFIIVMLESMFKCLIWFGIYYTNLYLTITFTGSTGQCNFLFIIYYAQDVQSLHVIFAYPVSSRCSLPQFIEAGSWLETRSMRNQIK